MLSVSSSRQPIRPLSRQLANQIAAGEVVERPASVVKELLENALDAGASQIDIDIEAGGSRLIRVRDNGSGIPRDELHLALSPHATSKIRTLDDLLQIRSMGFRGEALASIASVSELQLVSCYADEAWQIRSGQDSADIQPASHPPGTTVAVHNLFYNTPARRRFMKAERTEYRHIEDMVKRIALTRFDIGFQLRHNQRQIFALPPASSDEHRLQRLSRLLSKEFVQAAIEVDYQSSGLQLRGWLADGRYSRSQSDMQYFFVNGRMIRDKLITHALRQAYADTLYPGRFPVYVLDLQLDADQVDVNVHPTKHEVRFRQGRLVHDFLFYSLREALTAHGEGGSCEKNTFSQQAYTEPASVTASAVADQQAGYTTAMPLPPYHSADHARPLGVALSVVEHRYLLTQNEQGLLVVELERARRQLFAAQLQQALLQSTPLPGKPVLVPFSLTVEGAEHWLQQHQVQWQQLGFDFALLGENSIMVRQIPAIWQLRDIEAGLQLFCQQVSEGESLPDAMAEVQAQSPLDNEAQYWNALLRDMEQYLDIPGDCCYQLTARDMARWFSSP